MNYSRMFLNNKWGVHKIHELSTWAMFMNLGLFMNDQKLRWFHEPDKPATLTRFMMFMNSVHLDVDIVSWLRILFFWGYFSSEHSKLIKLQNMIILLIRKYISTLTDSPKTEQKTEKLIIKKKT